MYNIRRVKDAGKSERLAVTADIVANATRRKAADFRWVFDYERMRKL
jgi:hypothetical protein